MMRAWLVRGFLRLMGVLPLPANHAIGSLLGSLVAWLPSRARRIGRINIARCLPQLDAAAQRRLLRRSLREAGKTLTEMGIMWFASPRRIQRLVRETRGMALIEAAHASGKGVLFLTPHFGAWEISSLYHATAHPITCLYRPPRLRALEATLCRARSRTGARLVPTTAAGVRALYRALEDGEDAGLLPDQDPGRGGVFAPFFGIPANTMVLVPRLLQRTGATALLAWAERLPWGRGYRLHVEPLPAAVHDPDPVAAATAMNAAIEDLVRRRPEQYQWSYKRFRVRPPGERTPFYAN